MREIEFRGWNKKTAKWHHGNLLRYANGINTILHPRGSETGVEPETVGQYVGFTDRNGRRIYEGDLLRGDTFDGLARVMWFTLRGKLVLRGRDFNKDLWAYDGKMAEIVGNVHDNLDMARGLYE